MKKTIYIAMFLCIAFAGIARAQKRIELNTELMKSTFKIQGLDGSLGTVFILGKPCKGDSVQAFYVLVTAKHVLNDMKGDTAILFLRKINKDSTYIKIPYKIAIRQGNKKLWIEHETADVAAMYVPLPENVIDELLPMQLLVEDDIYTQIDIHPGDNFMCLGYPLGDESNEAGFPILRSGIIASYPLVPAKKIKTILFDVKIFKGNSGGPVYFVQSGRTYKGCFHAETAQFISGLISEEKLNISTNIAPYEISQKAQQLGLAVIVPAVFIKETINKLPNLK